MSVLIALTLANGAQAQLAAGMDEGGGELRIFDPTGAGRVLTPFGAAYSGGVRVALGDINRDGAADIIAGSGPGDSTSVRVFDGQTGAEFANFAPFGVEDTGGVYVAAGDVNGDGRADIITGAGAGGGPRVRVFDGNTRILIADFLAYDASFSGGVRVAAGDVNNDQRADIITGAGPGGGTQVRVFNGQTGAELHAFHAFEAEFPGGVHVASGDWDGGGVADIVVATGSSVVGGGPRVRVFNGSTGVQIADFYAYDLAFQGGVRVATGDIDGDGKADIITAPGSGGAPLIKQFLAPTALDGDSEFAFGPTFLGGVFVASAVDLPIVLRDGFE